MLHRYSSVPSSFPFIWRRKKDPLKYRTNQYLFEATASCPSLESTKGHFSLLSTARRNDAGLWNVSRNAPEIFSFNGEARFSQIEIPVAAGLSLDKALDILRQHEGDYIARSKGESGVLFEGETFIEILPELHHYTAASGLGSVSAPSFVGAALVT